MKNYYSKISCLIIAFSFSLSLFSQYQINEIGTAQIIDFDGYTADGFTPTPTAGQLSSEEWEVLGFSDGDLLFGGTGTTGDFARGTSTGKVLIGGVYSFNVGAGNGTSLGVQPIGADFTDGSFTLRIENNTIGTIEDLELSYEVWVLNDEDRANYFNFEHGADNVTFIQEPSLNLISTEVAAVTPVWEQNMRSITLTGVNIPVGGLYYLKWTGDDVSGSGSRDEFALDNISITGLNAGPTITATPNLLSGFLQTVGNPSAEQTFEVSAINLTDDLLLTLTNADYEISTTSGAGFQNSIIIEPTGGEITSTTIYVRLNGTATADPANGQVQINSLGATQEIVDLEGEIQEFGTGVINATPNQLTGFIQIIGAPSPEQTFEVTASKLSDDLVLTVITGEYEISDVSGTGFGTTLTINPTNGEITATDIYVRLNGTAVSNPENGTIELSSIGTNSLQVLLEGAIIESTAPNITATPNLLTGFEQQLGAGEGPSPSQVFEVEGSYLVDNILLSVSGDYEISLNEDGTYTNSITLNQTDGTVGVTNIYVRLNGPMAGDPVLGIVTLSSPDAEDEKVNLEGVILTASSEILATPETLTGFEQKIGVNGGPSESQMFEVEGIDLTDDILLSVSGDYEIAETIDGTYSNTLTLNEVDGTIEKTEIYVRLNGSEVEDPAIGSITLSSIGAAEVVVNLEGMIFEGCVINTDVMQDDGSLTAVIEDFNYRWINCDDYSWVSVPSGDERIFFPEENGSYAVILTDPEDINCSDTSDCYIVTTLNLSDQTLLEGVRVYPNPVENLLHIDANDEFIAKIEVRSIEGKLIYIEDNIYGSTSISSREWLKGVYLINIEMENKSRVVKVVK